MIDNKKSKAIKTLKSCLAEIEDPEKITENWIKQTADLLRAYLGENSELYQSMTHRSYLISVDTDNLGYKISQGQHFAVVVKRAIKIIEVQGIHKPLKKENWFEQIPGDWAVFIVTALLAIGAFIKTISDRYSNEQPTIKESPTIIRKDTNDISHPDTNRLDNRNNK